MNRRNFLKAAVAVAALPILASLPAEAKSTVGQNWDVAAAPEATTSREAEIELPGRPVKPWPPRGFRNDGWSVGAMKRARRHGWKRFG